MPSFKFDLKTLQAVARVASTDSTRFGLCGVHVVLSPSHCVRLEATNGQRLIRMDTSWEHDAPTKADFIIPSEVLARLVHCGNSREPERMIFEAEKVEMKLNGLSVEFAPIDCSYPDTGGVIPSTLPADFPAQRVALNEEFFAELAHLVRELAGVTQPGVEITCQSKGEPIFILGHKVIGVIMPMRVAFKNLEVL